ncbi:MAG: YezD family protein [Planctomycetaceae bacterium]|nr:YezD family protein [Planctomycetaceae bacterium]
MSAGEIDSNGLAAADVDREREIIHIREALRGLRFGTVNVIVQDGVVVQIDRTEKRRVRGAETKA